MTAATRGSVHRSVPYPCASAPSSSIPNNRFRCRGDRRAGRPGCGFARKALTPPRLTTACHRVTEDADEPTRRATSRTPKPDFSNATARRRRASNCVGLPLGLMSHILASFH